MQKITLAFIALLGLGTTALAQQKTTNTAPKKEEKKEIIIEEKSNGTKEKTVIVIENDKVTINGKPASEYDGKKHIVIDDDIIINGKQVRVPSQRKTVTIAGTGVPRAYLGVATEKDAKGAKITEVMEKSAAEKAGLKSGDIITNISGTAITGSEDLLSTVKKHKPEETVDITYLREGKEKKVKALLGKTTDATAYNFDGRYNYNYNFETPGVAIAPRVHGEFRSFNDGGMLWYSDDRPKFGMDVEDYADGDGVKVSKVEAETNAAKAGLQKDDIITGIEDKNVKNVDELRRALSESRDKSTLNLKVLRGGKPETLTLRVPKKIKTAEL
ncbi:MAG TPA: PDZ domain-containing protein [Phnomibacter sp.]|nr:PDZ domain-containing protein [Phnomibacter sp.]